jgi:hypothetical protein
MGLHSLVAEQLLHAELQSSQYSPDGMGCPSLWEEKAESQNSKYLITIKYKFMTYNSEQ